MSHLQLLEIIGENFRKHKNTKTNFELALVWVGTGEIQSPTSQTTPPPFPIRFANQSPSSRSKIPHKNKSRIYVWQCVEKQLVSYNSIQRRYCHRRLFGWRFGKMTDSEIKLAIIQKICEKKTKTELVKTLQDAICLVKKKCSPENAPSHRNSGKPMPLLFWAYCFRLQAWRKILCKMRVCCRRNSVWQWSGLDCIRPNR